MAVNYDLVIIGNTPEAFEAASKAIALKARIALVLDIQKDIIWREKFFFLTINYLLSINESLCYLQSWLTETISLNTKLANLSALGVDIIDGNGAFSCVPNLSFITSKYKLRSRSYLIGCGSTPIVPNILGLEETGYLTLGDIYQHQKLESLPEKLIIIGGSLSAIEIAHTLKSLNKQVTLLIANKKILPYENLKVNQFIRVLLETNGIKILTGSPIIQVKKIDNEKWLQAGNRAIEGDEIILATANRKPNIEGLNLEGIGVKFIKQGIQVNDKLQTTNPKIYACGDILGGYSFNNIAKYEAHIAIKNALFLPLFKVNYDNLPLNILTFSELARVGMTEKIARNIYGQNVVILEQFFKNLALAQIREQTTGFCQIVTLKNGQILGATIIGKQGSELISIIALAIKKGGYLTDLASFIYAPPSYSEIIDQIAEQWQRDRFNNNTNLTNFLETLWIWLRQNYQ